MLNLRLHWLLGRLNMREFPTAQKAEEFYSAFILCSSHYPYTKVIGAFFKVFYKCFAAVEKAFPPHRFHGNISLKVTVNVMN